MNNLKPIVSVLMPVFNGERFLSEAVDSILNQSFADFEFLIIDDGSSDDTATILDSYLDSRIIRIYHPINLGITTSLNEGIAQAKGMYIARMDADDISMPDRFQKQISFLDAHSEVGVLGTFAKIIDEMGKPVEHYTVPSTHGLIAWALAFGRAFAHPTVMMRAALLKKISGYPTNANFCEDVALWVKLIELTRFANLKEDLLIYRTHSSSISRVNSRVQTEGADEYRRIYISNVIDDPIRYDFFTLLRESQHPSHHLSEIQIQTVIGLILKFHSNLNKKGFFVKEESDLVLHELSLKIYQIIKNKKPILGFSILKKSKRLYKNFLTKFKAVIKNKLMIIDERKSLTDMKLKTNQAFEVGSLSIIILTYNRDEGLRSLLKSIINQNLEGLRLELIICNNFGEVDIAEIIDKKIIESLNEIANLKIIQSSYNWRDKVRYGLATLAKYDTILFLDDDVVLVNNNFIHYMYENFQKLREIDILSCWNLLWTNCTDHYFDYVSLTFFSPEIIEITQSDVCGTGVCMFNRKIILNSGVFDIATARSFPDAYDMAFSIAASMEYGSNGYYLPSYGMLKFHDEYQKNALHNIPGIYKERYGLFKTLYRKGYMPVIQRSSFVTNPDTPENTAIRNMEEKRQGW